MPPTTDPTGSRLHHVAFNHPFTNLDQERTTFPRTGLIDQLTYERISPEDATYGVYAAGADWMEQPAKTAA